MSRDKSGDSFAFLGDSAAGFTQPPASSSPASDLPAVGEHLIVHEILGRGGMGDVHRAHDTRLDRPVALKVLQRRHAHNADLRARFLAEARAQAQLAHPGVVPVHEIGTDEEGRPYFTMEINRGRTLAEVFLDDRSEDVPRPWLEFIRRASEVVAFAHSRDVLHRDLKPGNVMVGRFGEVHVLDWGLVQHGEGQADGVLGTAGYLAPEAARGEAVGPGADVYGLGAMLFEVLAGHPPVTGTMAQRLAQASRGEIGTLPSTVPDDLRALVLRSLSADLGERFEDAGPFSLALGAWLDGAARRARALEVFARSMELEPEITRQRQLAGTHAASAQTLAVAVSPSAPVAEKAALWSAQDAALAAREAADTAERHRVDLLLQALSHDPDLPEAHRELGRWYRQEAEAAEARGEGSEAALARVRFYDDGTHAAFLKGDGAVTLRTDPPGAEVRLHRMVERGRRLVAEPVRVLGRTPLDAVPLPKGSWLLTLHAPGYEVVRYPVSVGRLEHWQGIPPGETEPFAVHLPPVGSIPEGSLYVPAGWFVFGADGLDGTWPRQRRWEEGFVARRFAVTNREYLSFLDSLVAQGREDEALAAVPRAPTAQETDKIDPIYGRDAQGRHILVPDGDGDLWLPEWPVIAIPWTAARAFARWESERTGARWDLPEETQWEKAARGVDGRAYPWGDAFDSTFALVYDSFPDRPNLAPVQDFPDDRSVYGVQGMAGGVREWCLPRFVRPGSPPLPMESVGDRLFRGGCWHLTGVTAQTTTRSRLFQGRVSDLGGFRLFGGIPGGSGVG